MPEFRRPDFNITTQEIPKQEIEAINTRYNRVEKRVGKIITKGVIGMLCGAFLTIATGIYAGTRPNPFENRAVVSRYKTDNMALESLGKERKDIELNLSYQHKVFGNRQEVITSLDSTIKEIKSDIEEIKNDQIFKKYKSWEYPSIGTKVSESVGMTAGLTGLLACFGGIGYLVVNEERKKKELKRVAQRVTE